MTQVRKHKVDLADYDSQKDIQHRIALSVLSKTDLEVLSEIVCGPLYLSLQSLEESLDLSQEQIQETLATLEKTALFTRNGEFLSVDKEMRKYYECQLARFEEDFIPGMDFIQAQLARIPIHVLPNWYSLPRTSDNIFKSIVEKYLITPKIYDRYLSEIVFDEPVLYQIMKEVFNSSQFEVSADFLREKFQLSSEDFERCMLYLELQFVCYLHFKPQGDGWQAVVTPFQEWVEFLRFKKESVPTTISNPAEVKRKHSEGFGFVKEMKSVLACVADACPFFDSIDPSCKQYISKLLLLEMIALDQGRLKTTDEGLYWMQKSDIEAALILYRHPLNPLPGYPLVSERAIRDVEKSLKRIMSLGWVYYDDFLKGFMESLTPEEPLILKKIGSRKWKYVLPVLSPGDKTILSAILLERMFEVGVVAVGEHEGRTCLSITPYGQKALCD